MRRVWMTLLGFLGIVTTSCLGFTVERSSPEIGNLRNSSGSSLDSDRRITIEKIFNGDVHPIDVENILHDSEIKLSAKLPDEKCSSSSENPHRAKRSDELLHPSNRLTSVDRLPSELKESTIVSSNREGTKTPEIAADKIVSNVKQSTIVTSSSIKPNTELNAEKIVSSPKKSTNLSLSPTEPKTLVKDAERIALSAKKSTIVSSSSTEPKALEKTSDEFAASLKQSTNVSSASLESKNSEIIPDKSVDGENLKNVVLLLIDDAGTRHKSFMKNFEAAKKFPVQGFVQNCRTIEPSDTMRFPLGDSVIPQKKDEDCECDRFLRANVASFLAWANHVKEMTTDAVSAANFSIPLSMSYDGPINRFAKDFEDNDETLHRDNNHEKSDTRDNWRSIDLEKQSSQSVPATIAWGPNWKQENANGNDGMWDVFDMFSRIRIAFFRILLESLGNMTGTEEEFNGKKPFNIQPSAVELVTDAIRELKSVPNDKGFILVVSTSGNELSAAIDVIEREITTKDTLLLIAGTCSTFNEPVPFFAHGPGERSFLGARTIWDLPGMIRGAMTKNCGDETCKSEKQEEPRALPSLELSSLPSQDIPHKRVARATSEEDASESTVEEKSTKESDEENEGTPKGGRSSGAQDIRIVNVTKFIAIFTSIVAMLALKSS